MSHLLSMAMSYYWHRNSTVTGVQHKSEPQAWCSTIEPCPRNSTVMALRSWGFVHPLLSLQFPQGISLGPYRDTAPAQSKQPFTFAFYLCGTGGREEQRVSCPILAFRLLSRKGPSQALSWDHSCSPLPHLWGLTSIPSCCFPLGHVLQRGTNTAKAGDRLHMAPNDMLLIASCAPQLLPRTRRSFCVPAQADCPAHLGTS